MTTFAVKKPKRRVCCNDFYYTDGKKVKRLSEWKDHFGQQVMFTYSLGSLNHIVVTDEIKNSGENQIAILTKV